MVLIEAALFAAAFGGAYLLRFEFSLTGEQWNRIGLVLLCLVPVKLCVFFVLGLYKGMWRYAGMHDFWRLAEACLLSSLLAEVVVRFIFGSGGFSHAVYFLDGFLTFILTGGARMIIRTCHEVKTSSGDVQILRLPRFRQKPGNRKRILIIGAGGSGEKILREIFENPHVHYEVVGFLDDNPGKKGRTIHGVPVLGPADHLPRVLEEHGIDQVFLSIPSATGPQMRRIVEICKGCGVSFKTLPAIGQIIDGRVGIKSLRDVNYEDLLRRPPVHLDMAGIRDCLADRTVMVTGAGGSIGSELCRQLIRFHPKRLVLVDAGEANLYNIQMELCHEHNFDAYHAILARVQDESIMEEIFNIYRPEAVFHAAAYKHVPLLEGNPWEAVSNNVEGSRVVIEMAAKYKAVRCVLVSTDKAVKPTNIMGTSKRVSELILQSVEGNDTLFMAVRFGNVFASAGSVIPLFRRQIEHGGPVTVTHPEVTRYFMTIPESAQLILQAGALGRGGEIFLLEMGTPVKIADLAMDLIRLSGKEPGRDIKVVFTGLRPGEKLYEELITEGEDVIRTGHEKIMVLRRNGNWNGNGFASRDRFRSWLRSELQELRRIAGTHDAHAIKRKLKELVPEYTPQETECIL